MCVAGKLWREREKERETREKEDRRWMLDGRKQRKRERQEKRTEKKARPSVPLVHTCTYVEEEQAGEGERAR